MSRYETNIVRVKAGNSGFFTEIVADFQDIALASAYAWLGEREMARDVVQEAFLDAYLNLDQLRTPAAFPGWFRRIVYKHCDRQSRGKTLPLVSIDEATDISSPEIPTLNGIITLERDQQIRHLVETLPAEQRMIVALHYFSDVSGQQIADFLELPLSTVKQRLRVARIALKKADQSNLPMMKKNIQSESLMNFPDEIAMFIAIRQGDVQELARLLAKMPGLINAEQNWHRDLVYSGILPFATRATALITTIELDELEMLKLLLNKGADPDGKCGCETAESPLWAAALRNRIAHAECLLEAGANPNIVSASGNTPLHIAAMRGHGELVKLLLKHGANREAREQDSSAVWPLTAGATKEDGWRPLQWAQHNGHIEVAKLLDGQTLPATTKNITNIDQSLLRTGIKAVDFFTPLARGGLTRLPFKAGVGMLVLLGELSQVFLSHPNGAVVWTGFTQPPFDVAELKAELDELGLLNRVQSCLVNYGATADEQRAGFMRGIDMINNLRDKDKEVLAIIQSSEGFEADIEQGLFKLAQKSKPTAVTSIVLTPFRDELPASSQSQNCATLNAPYTSLITLDRTRSVKNLYPGIDPALSLSKANIEELGALHVQLAKEVRELLAWYRTQDPEFDCLNEIASDDKTTRARKLINYFTQPFKITEAFRGTPGESVPWDLMLAGVDKIVRRVNKQ